MMLNATTRRLALIVLLAATMLACNNTTNSSQSSSACDRLSEFCESCANAEARANCFQAVNLELESTCQQLLDDDTYDPDGVECSIN
jgi:hypothetical protein